MTDGPYYEKDGAVFRRPVVEAGPDGAPRTAMGFKVCDLNPDVAGAGEVIVKALNAHEAA